MLKSIFREDVVVKRKRLAEDVVGGEEKESYHFGLVEPLKHRFCQSRSLVINDYPVELPEIVRRRLNSLQWLLLLKPRRPLSKVKMWRVGIRTIPSLRAIICSELLGIRNGPAPEVMNIHNLGRKLDYLVG
jgi:hypothetical protein